MNDMVLPPRNGLSLCAGGGGLDMGLGLAEPGFATSCYVEIEEYPRQCLIAGQRAGYLHAAPIWDDLKRFNARPWRGQIDTLLAGYPCQPFSAAGQRLGDKDPRHLWPDICRIIDELDPRWCLFENVAGHVSLGLDTVLRDLREMGRTVAAGIFSAGETGAPHERQRVFIVAYRECSAGERECADIGGPDAQADRRHDALWGCGKAVSVADTDGRDARAERQQRGGEQRLHPEGGGTGRGDVGHTSRLGRREGRTEHEFWSGRHTSADDGGRVQYDMADTGQPGPQGRERAGASVERHGAPASGPAAQLRRPLLHAPGPADMDLWRAVLDLAPDLAPASSLGDVVSVANVAAQMVAAGHMEEAAAEQLVRGMAHGLAERPRALRLLGNGVHPLPAGHAWRSLSASLGLRPVELGGACADAAGPAADAVVRAAE